MDISEIMNTDVATVRPGTTVMEAARVLSTSQASDLMVVDDDGTFVGVLSEGDLLRAVMPHFEDVMFQCGSLAGAFQSFVEEGRILAARSIDSLMITEPIVVRDHNHPLRAAAAMVTHQIRRLPVLDSEGKLVGSISRADIAQAIMTK
jgi:CBS domain-containing protein